VTKAHRTGVIKKPVEEFMLPLMLGRCPLEGEVTIAGVLFTDAADNVIPDVVWVSHQRLASLLDEAGHLTAAPN